MAKKIKIEGEIVEQNEFYKVIKESSTGKFYIFSKYDDTMYTASEYKIIGTAVLENNNGEKFYSNFVNSQAFGQGRCLSNRMEIDSWKTKVVEGKEQTVVKYFDEKGYKYIRYVDEQGNLYKKKSQKQLQEIEIVSL